MKKAFLLCLTVLLLVGCLPTPDADFVPQKDMTAMLEKARSTQQPEVVTFGIDAPKENGQSAALPKLRECYGIPETYSHHAELAEGHFILNVEAEVLVPDADAIPIVRIERTNFDPETVRTLFNALCGDTEMYYQRQTYSKSQIADRIRYLSEQISDEQAYRREYGEEGLANTKAEIERLKENYASAPEIVEDERCYGELIPYASNGANGPVSSNLIAEMGIQAYSKDMTVCFIAANPEPDPSSRLWQFTQILFFRTTKQRPQNTCFFRVPKEYRNDAYSPEQAETDVGAFLMQSGLDDFTVSTVQYAPEQITAHPDDPMYRALCTRTVGAARSAYCDDWAYDCTDMFGPSWAYENLSVWIDRDGIQAFEWAAPIRVCSTVVENAALLPFDEIMEIYLRMVHTKFAAAINLTDPDLRYGATIRSQYDIDRIELTLQRIQEPDVWDSALLVPVWNFYGVNTRTEVEDYIESEESRWLCNSMLSINAIDGTVIDVHKGY